MATCRFHGSGSVQDPRPGVGGIWLHRLTAGAQAKVFCLSNCGRVPDAPRRAVRRAVRKGARARKNHLPSSVAQVCWNNQTRPAWAASSRSQLYTGARWRVPFWLSRALHHRSGLFARVSKNHRLTGREPPRGFAAPASLLTLTGDFFKRSFPGQVLLSSIPPVNTACVCRLYAPSPSRRHLPRRGRVRHQLTRRGTSAMRANPRLAGRSFAGEQGCCSLQSKSRYRARYGRGPFHPARGPHPRPRAFRSTSRPTQTLPAVNSCGRKTVNTMTGKRSSPAAWSLLQHLAKFCCR